MEKTKWTFWPTQYIIRRFTNFGTYRIWKRSLYALLSPSPMLQIRNWRPREINWFVQGHTVWKWENLGLEARFLCFCHSTLSFANCFLTLAILKPDIDLKGCHMAKATSWSVLAHFIMQVNKLGRWKKKKRWKEKGRERKEKKCSLLIYF